CLLVENQITRNSHRPQWSPCFATTIQKSFPAKEMLGSPVPYGLYAAEFKIFQNKYLTLKYLARIYIWRINKSSSLKTCNNTNFDLLQVISEITKYVQSDWNVGYPTLTGDPRIVDEWVQGLEIIFEVMNYPDRYRGLCAQIQLTGDARLWWHAYWSMRPGEKDGCTWDQFKELIREKYYPSYYRADMERQFLALTQGTRSVDEYEREFTRLGAF
ncbi:Unknown protein, partial [Striga hermonthica]